PQDIKEKEKRKATMRFLSIFVINIIYHVSYCMVYSWIVNSFRKSNTRLPGSHQIKALLTSYRAGLTGFVLEEPLLLRLIHNSDILSTTALHLLFIRHLLPPFMTDPFDAVTSALEYRMATDDLAL